MNIQLTPEQEQMVTARIQSGRYSSPNEVVQQALQLMDRDDEKLLVLRSRLDAGMAQADQGESADGETFMQSLLDGLDSQESATHIG